LVTPAALAVTGTDAAYAPAGSPARLTESVNVAGAVVALSEAMSHPADWPAPYVVLPTASPLSVPVPPFVIAIAVGAGFDPPTAPVNEAAEDPRVIAGGGVTVSDTVTTCGLLVTPAALAVTGTDAAYAPAGSPARLTESVNVAGAVVALSEAMSHPAGWPAPYVVLPTASPLSVPVPPFVIAIAVGAGFDPPATPVSEAATVPSAITGAATTGGVVPDDGPVAPPPSPPPHASVSNVAATTPAA
jgi:hypothetical protein